MSNCCHQHFETYDTGYGVDKRCLDCGTITDAEDKPKPAPHDDEKEKEQ